MFKGADKTKKDIEEAADKAEECKSNKPSDSITKNLMELQVKYWDVISKSDEKYVNKVAIVKKLDL